MNGADFDALFDTFTRTAFRFQGRPFYAVGGAEAERIAAFHRGEPRPERSVRTDRWLARIATTTINESKSWTRVCTVDHPLNDDQRYRLESHRESQAAGEHVLLAARTPEIDAVGEDFWLFDAATPDAFAVLMHYADDGSVRDREYLPPGHRGLGDLQVVAERLMDVAAPLNVFLAGLSVADG